MKGDKAFIFTHADLKNMFTFSNTFPCTDLWDNITEVPAWLWSWHLTLVSAVVRAKPIPWLTAGFPFWGQHAIKSNSTHFTVVALSISQHQTLKTATRRCLEIQRPWQHLIWSHISLSGHALLRDKDKAALGLVSWLFWILLKCLMMLWTYLLIFLCVSECAWAHNISSPGVCSCVCVSSLSVWKVFVLHVCI